MPGFAPKVGLTFETLQDWDKEHEDDLLISVACYGEPDDPRYAAIWHPAEPKKKPRRREFRQHRTYDRPMEAGTDVPARFAPIFGTATGDVRQGGAIGVSTLWVYDEYGRTSDTPKQTAVVKTTLTGIMTGSGFLTCRSLDAVWYRKPQDQYSGSYQVDYLAVFSPIAESVFGVFRPEEHAVDRTLGGVHGLLGIETARKGFKRVHVAIPAPKNVGTKRPIVAHMRGDTYERWPDDIKQGFKGGTVVDGPIDYAGLTPAFNQRVTDQGLTAIQIGANGIGSNVRFCITWAPTLTPKTRMFRLVDGASPDPVGRVEVNAPNQPPTVSFSSYDQATTDQLYQLRTAAALRMAQINCSNAQIAIAVDGRLKLLWSLTYGERGWPLTQPQSKLRFASCVKTLMAMRAVSLGESFLKSSIVDAMGVDLDPFAWGGEKLANSTVEDCLRMVSGWKGGPRVKNETWRDGRQSLPLRAGDLGGAIQNAFKLVDYETNEPRTKEVYNNTGFIALSEAIGKAGRNDRRRCLDALRDWWPDAVNEEMLDVIPPTRNESLDAGEVPMRDRVCIERNTDTTAGLLPALEAAGQVPPWTPGGYRFRDADFLARYMMSAATMVRLLQMMHPPGSVHSSLAGNRMTVDQLFRMASKQADLPEYSLGCRTRVNPSVPFLEFFKGGTFGSGESSIHHFVFWPAGLDESSVRTMSVAAVTNCKGALADALPENTMLRLAALSIYQAGGWNNNVDLFPELGLV